MIFRSDESLPFRGWYTRVNTVRGSPPPIIAMIASLTIAVVLSFLNLGGTAAFNSNLRLVTGAVGLTYALSIGCVLWRRVFGEPLAHTRWSLGKLRVLINSYALLYEIFTVTINFFRCLWTSMPFRWTGQLRCLVVWRYCAQSTTSSTARNITRVP